MLAHFDPHGQVAPHVRRTVRAVARECAELVIVSTADLTSDATAWLGRYGALISRVNTGHDFASYRAGLDAVGGDFDQIVLLNDSAVLAHTDLSQIFTTMAGRGADFWGLTPGFGFAPHVQSYFMVFQRRALEHPVWQVLWLEMDHSVARSEVIVRSEVGLTTLLTGAGLRADTYFRPTALDRVRGRHAPMLRNSGGASPTGAGARRPAG